jgi:hypothetical protein
MRVRFFVETFVFLPYEDAGLSLVSVCLAASLFLSLGICICTGFTTTVGRKDNKKLLLIYDLKTCFGIYHFYWLSSFETKEKKQV